MNQLESTFIALCGYELYVSEELYNKYYDVIIKKTTKKSEKKLNLSVPHKREESEDDY